MFSQNSENGVRNEAKRSEKKRKKAKRSEKERKFD
jgi:hypothetical protein